MDKPLTRDEIQAMINKAIADYAGKAKYGVAQIPAHNHDGVNSAKINIKDIDGLNQVIFTF